MARYRKKPAEVEAWQVGSDEPMPEWARDRGLAPFYWQGNDSYFVMEEGRVVVLSAFTFEQTYEVVK